MTNSSTEDGCRKDEEFISWIMEGFNCTREQVLEHDMNHHALWSSLWKAWYAGKASAQRPRPMDEAPMMGELVHALIPLRRGTYGLVDRFNNVHPSRDDGGCLIGWLPLPDQDENTTP